MSTFFLSYIFWFVKCGMDVPFHYLNSRICASLMHLVFYTPFVCEHGYVSILIILFSFFTNFSHFGNRGRKTLCDALCFWFSTPSIRPYGFLYIIHFVYLLQISHIVGEGQ
jgi:hypothetical protein